MLGTPFSGSTALANAVNNLFGQVSLGELDRLPGYIPLGSERQKSICSFCQLDYSECCDWLPQGLNVPASFRANHHSQGLLEIARLHPLGLMIDGSKNVNYVSQKVDELAGLCDFKFIVLSRPPLDWMGSFLSRSHYEAWEAANIWRDTYRHALSFSLGSGLPMMHFDTTRLLGPNDQDVRKAVREVAAFAGISSASGGDSDRVDLFKPTHQIGGNLRVQGRHDVDHRPLNPVDIEKAFLMSPSAVDTAMALGIARLSS